MGTYRFAIRDTTTGESRECSYEAADVDRCDFYWLEGNMACDCNRRLYFERAAGNEPGDGDLPCGDGRYRYDWVEADGVRIVEDDKPTGNARDD